MKYSITIYEHDKLGESVDIVGDDLHHMEPAALNSPQCNHATGTPEYEVIKKECSKIVNAIRKINQLNKAQ